MTEAKRDLQADLELCKCATPGPWWVSENGFSRKRLCPTVYTADNELRYIAFCDDRFFLEKETDNLANARFIAEARTGWPHAIRRALEAEARVAELGEEVERLRQEIESHDPEGRNYTNKQYVGLLMENEKLRKVIGDIWSFAMERYEKADEEGCMWKKDIYGEILEEIVKLRRYYDLGGGQDNYC